MQGCAGTAEEAEERDWKEWSAVCCGKLFACSGPAPQCFTHSQYVCQSVCVCVCVGKK